MASSEILTQLKYHERLVSHSKETKRTKPNGRIVTVKIALILGIKIIIVHAVSLSRLKTAQNKS
jgi:hypothetical protein